MNIEQIKQQAISMRSLMKDGGIWIQHNPFPSVIKHQAIELLESEGLQYEADYLEATFDHIKQSIDFE